jgi:hypothetical protein
MSALTATERTARLRRRRAAELAELRTALLAVAEAPTLAAAHSIAIRALVARPFPEAGEARLWLGASFPPDTTRQEP